LPALCAAALLLAITGTASAQYAGPAVSTPQAGTAQVITTDRGLLYPSVPEFQISPGDLISISIFGQTAYAPSIRVDVAGQVLLPYIGLVKLGGLTITQAELLVANDLQTGGIYRDPQISLQIIEGPSANATIVGEAHAIVPVIGSRTLLQALAFAGGLPPTASHVVTIDRPGVAQPIVVDLGSNPEQSALANIPILPGDTIVTSRVGVAYLIGSFKTQGPIPLSGNSPMTLMIAASLAGGPSFEARYSDLRLIRTINGQRTVVRLNIHKILYGEAPDPILRPDDIVFLPANPIKAALTNGSEAQVLTFATLALSVYSIFRY
jgi:polysaccharide export outer membrane protein